MNLNWGYGSIAFISYKASKNKNRSVTSFPASFSAWFLRKNIFLYYIFLIDQIS